MLSCCLPPSPVPRSPVSLFSFSSSVSFFEIVSVARLSQVFSSQSSKETQTSQLEYAAERRRFGSQISFAHFLLHHPNCLVEFSLNLPGESSGVNLKTCMHERARRHGMEGRFRNIANEENRSPMFEKLPQVSRVSRSIVCIGASISLESSILKADPGSPSPANIHRSAQNAMYRIHP